MKHLDLQIAELVQFPTIFSANFFFQASLLNIAVCSLLGAGMFPPAVKFVHLAVAISNNKISAIDTGFKDFPPRGSVTLRE